VPLDVRLSGLPNRHTDGVRWHQSHKGLSGRLGWPQLRDEDRFPPVLVAFQKLVRATEGSLGGSYVRFGGENPLAVVAPPSTALSSQDGEVLTDVPWVLVQVSP
jgi:hypothetical protein